MFSVPHPKRGGRWCIPKYEIRNQASIAALKARVASVSGIPADRQRLIFRGRVLPSDAERLRDVAGFRDGDALHMVASSVARTDSVLTSGSEMTASNTMNTMNTMNANALDTNVPGFMDVPGVLDALLHETARLS